MQTHSTSESAGSAGAHTPTGMKDKDGGPDVWSALTVINWWTVRKDEKYSKSFLGRSGTWNRLRDSWSVVRTGKLFSLWASDRPTRLRRYHENVQSQMNEETSGWKLTWFMHLQSHSNRCVKPRLGINRRTVSMTTHIHTNNTGCILNSCFQQDMLMM